MKKSSRLLALSIGILGFWAAPPAQAQSQFSDVVRQFEARFEPPEAKPGQTVKWIFTLEPIPGWHTYPTSQPDPNASTYVTKFRSPDEPANSVIFVGEVTDPPNFYTEELVALNGSPKVRMYGEKVVWEWTGIVSPQASPGTMTVGVRPKITVCDESNVCIPYPNRTIDTELTVLEGSVPVAAEYQDEVDTVLNPPPPSPLEGPGRGGPSLSPTQPAVPTEIVPPADTLEEHQENLNQLRQQLPSLENGDTTSSSAGLGTLLLTAVFWGLISLVTPCVFPMIPITVSFFLKSGEHSTRRTYTQALVYCVTIILVLGTSAFSLLSLFRALSVDPYMNLFLGGLFVFFALSLFGMYEITLPSGLARFTSGREKQGGMAGTIFMALTFTIISFTCVAPFLGGFSGMAATGNYATWELALAGFAFATAFALPFFLLALFPKLLRKLPKSGNWLNTVKVVMGFLELAAALKFFRTAELRLLPHPEFFTYDFVLGLWVALAVFCGLYLLNLYRLPHDYPQEHIGVLRMLFGILFVGLGIYLTPALFRTGDGEKQRPSGAIYAWIDSFLLPEPEETNWSANLKGTLDNARRIQAESGKPSFVFVDFTGVTCTNCKLNEQEVFTQGAVRSLFQSYHLVQMYTDTVPQEFYTTQKPTDERRDEEAFANLQFQRDVFGTEQLPLYVILEPFVEDGEDKVKVRSIYDEGKINDVDAFIEFLKSPFEQPAQGDTPE